ncbi:Tad domain-containing protein [Neobacillus niacini]|uniref:Tad domain-containing protein n=1 Tax=Neobacillus niacini TaxID=86668 RepID=UPI002FFFF7A2
MKKFFINNMKIIWKNQQGSSMVLVACLLIFICGISALVVDIGTVYVEKGNLQKTLDAAALAGASELMVSENKAENTAIDIASKNKLTITASDIDTASNFIEIKKTVEADLTFARIVGIETMDVPAIAKAQLKGGLSGREGIVPVAIPRDKLPDPSDPFPEFPLNFQPGKGNDEENSSIKGNFGYLSIDGTGGNVLRNNIINGADLEVSEEMYEYTQTGLSWGNVKAGFQERINQDLSNPDCSKYETADSSCSRVILVPIVESFTDVSGKTMVEITGFASVWISKITGHTVQTQFIETITFGEFEDLTGADNYHVFGVALVK